MNIILKHQGIFVVGLLLVLTLKVLASDPPRDAMKPEPDRFCAQGISAIPGLSGAIRLAPVYTAPLSVRQMGSAVSALFGGLSNLSLLRTSGYYESRGFVDHSADFSTPEKFSFAFTPGTIADAKQHLVVERNELLISLRKRSQVQNETEINKIDDNKLVRELAIRDDVKGSDEYKAFVKVLYTRHFLDMMYKTHQALSFNNYQPNMGPGANESKFPHQSRRLFLDNGSSLYYLNYKKASADAKQTFAALYPEIDMSALGVGDLFPIDENYHIDDASVLQNFGGIFPYRLADRLARVP